MPINEFIDLYNGDISQSRDQSYNFPGVSLELRYNKKYNYREQQDPLLLDEIASLILINQSNGTMFIEVMKQEKPWLFNIDEHDDSKFYKSVTQASNLQQSNTHDITNSPAAI